MISPLRFVAFAMAMGVPASGAAQNEPSAPPFQDRFEVDPAELSPTGRNPYFILEPGYVLRFEGTEDGGKASLVITVLDITKTVADVETRVVEEKEFLGGELVEISRKYFAIPSRANDVYYFGEDVDIYEDGRIRSHEGSWLAGSDENRFGLIMPSIPEIGRRYYQEIAPGVAMDRPEIVSLTDSLETPIGKLYDLLKTEETSLLEPDAKERKYYAPGIGLVSDGGMRLVAHTE